MTVGVDAGANEEARLSCAAETRVLLAAVSASLLHRKAPAMDAAIPFDWAAFTALAQRNKLFAPAVSGLGGAVPPPVAEAAARYRAITLRMNGANLTSTRAVLAALGAEGVEPVVIKGPLAQYPLYGDYFTRPSADVDLLVEPKDFGAASRVLGLAGYRRAAPCASPWWRMFLGEEHYVSDERGCVAVDLHHRLQQPGCPSPARHDLFFGETAMAMLGDRRIPILAPPGALLLACMSLVKGMVHREPSGAYAGDIAAHIVSGAPDAVPDAFKLAGMTGLRNTLQTGLRAADVLFGIRAADADGGALGVCSDEELTALILAPETVAHPPARTKMLWALCDGSGEFAREFVWKLAADALRGPLDALAGR